jgi:hypothetical protein
MGLSSAANHHANLNSQMGKINNFLTIDVSGNTPVNNLGMPPQTSAAMHTINTSQSAQREFMAASRIPKQKVLNIKIKEN